MSLCSTIKRKEDLELITNKDLVAAAHELMGGIDLDPASSKVANEYVQADNFYTPQDDGINRQQWFGKVYVFPPSGTYFWDRKYERWKMTRTSSSTLKSSHALWFQFLYNAWLSGEIEQGLYFSNCPDMIRYDQRIFDFPMCILRTAPVLIKNTSEGIGNHKTCTSFLVYLQPMDRSAEATERFVEIYSPKGRVLC